MKQRISRPWAEQRQRQRPRLLVEDPDPALQVSEFRLFEEAGFEIALCSGPGEDEPCPLLHGGDCDLVGEADLVLMGPGMAVDRAELSAAIHELRPDLPVVVQVPRSDPDACPPGCTPDPCPVSIKGEVRLLWRVLDERATRWTGQSTPKG